MRVLRRLRAGLPDRHAEREIGDRDRDARALRGHHLRLLRRRLRLQGRDARRRGRAHAALQGRQGQSRPFLRQGPLRLRLRHPQRPHAEADDQVEDHRSVARSVLGRGDQLRGLGVQAHPGEIWQELRRRHHLLALHQRRDLPRAEARARGLRQQQCRYLRAGVPFADRLRAEDHLRHLGRHAGLRLGRAGRRDHDHRRQPDRRPSGVRLSHEEAAAPGRQADHPRSAPHRPRAHAAYRGRLPSAAQARHQRRRGHLARPCRRHRRAGEREIRARALRLGRVPGLGRVRLRQAPQPRGSREAHRRSRRVHPRRGAALCHRRQRRHLLRPRRHRAQPGLDHGDGHRQSRHGHRQYRPRGRRREPTSWAEQRAGLLRHGIVPARGVGLPARLRGRDPRHVRVHCGAGRSTRSLACASPT